MQLTETWRHGDGSLNLGSFFEVMEPHGPIVYVYATLVLYARRHVYFFLPTSLLLTWLSFSPKMVPIFMNMSSREAVAVASTSRPRWLVGLNDGGANALEHVARLSVVSRTQEEGDMWVFTVPVQFFFRTLRTRRLYSDWFVPVRKSNGEHYLPRITLLKSKYMEHDKYLYTVH